MKTQLGKIALAIVTIILIAFGWVYRFVRRYYRRFCINVLWKHFRIRTSVYHKWHAKRAKKLQEMLDNEHSVYPSF